MKQTRIQMGITLISLVITIIVLLILAGVSINLISEGDGIIEKGDMAVKNTNKAIVIDEINLKLIEQKFLGISATNANLKAIMSTYGEVVENEDGSFSVVLDSGESITSTEILNGINPDKDDETTYIYNKEQLVAFKNQVDNGETFAGKTVMLMADIDLGGNENDESTWWTGIGTLNSNDFCGIFDGNGYSISNIYMKIISDGTGVAFFNSVSDATIKELTIVGNGIKIGNSNISGFVLQSKGNTVIENCCNKVNIFSEGTTYSAAGFVLIQRSGKLVIINSINYGNIIGCDNSSAFLGINNTANITIDNCKNYGEIISITNSAGAFCSDNRSNSNLEILNSINYGKIEAINAGGFVGWNADKSILKLDKCINNGIVKGNYKVGGFIASTSSSTEITGCINLKDVLYENTATINDNNYFGGIIGLINISVTTNPYTVKIINSANYGKVSNSKFVASGIIGMCCNSKTEIINCYNKGELIGKLCCGVTYTWCSNTALTNNVTVDNFWDNSSKTGGSLGACSLVKRNSNSIVKVNNSYYLKGTIGNSDFNADCEDDSIAMDDTDMKSEEFVKLLNSNITETSLKMWKYNKNDYPTFE